MNYSNLRKCRVEIKNGKRFTGVVNEIMKPMSLRKVDKMSLTPRRDLYFSLSIMIELLPTSRSLLVKFSLKDLK